MNRWQRYAVGYFLCDVPTDMTYAEILAAIEDTDDDITIWEPFECYDPEQITEWMDLMVDTLKTDFPAKKKKKAKS